MSEKVTGNDNESKDDSAMEHLKKELQRRADAIGAAENERRHNYVLQSFILGWLSGAVGDMLKQEVLKGKATLVTMDPTGDSAAGLKITMASGRVATIQVSVELPA